MTNFQIGALSLAAVILAGPYIWNLARAGLARPGGKQDRLTINHLIEMAEGVQLTDEELKAITAGAQAMAAAIARHRLAPKPPYEWEPAD